MTEAERGNYQRIIKGIARQFGKNCEVVLHDYSQPYESTIVSIENSHITGRKVGDCGTNLGLEILHGVSNGEDQYNYITQLKNNRLLRSTSIYLRGENDEIIGSICINFDITDILAAKNTLEDMSYIGHPVQDAASDKPEEFITNDINSLLDLMIEKAVAEIGVPSSQMTKEQKTKAIKYLEKHGALMIKKSAERISAYFGISKYTLYNYLNENDKSKL